MYEQMRAATKKLRAYPELEIFSHRTMIRARSITSFQSEILSIPIFFPKILFLQRKKIQSGDASCDYYVKIVVTSYSD